MQAQSNILAFPVNAKLDQAKANELAIIKAGFNDLVRNPQQKNPSSPGGIGAAVGAYAMPISTFLAELFCTLQASTSSRCAQSVNTRSTL
jgi:hypothetical protein